MGCVNLMGSPAPPLSTVFICLRHCLASSLQREVASTAARRPAGVSAIQPCWASSAARTVCREGGRELNTSSGIELRRLCGPAVLPCWNTELWTQVTCMQGRVLSICSVAAIVIDRQAESDRHALG